MAQRKPRGVPFTSETAKTRGSPGRKPGAKNKWRKADLAKLREHIQNVMDERKGSLEDWLAGLTDRELAAIVRDQASKPPVQVEADVEQRIRWMTEEEAKEHG